MAIQLLEAFGVLLDVKTTLSEWAISDVMTETLEQWKVEHVALGRLASEPSMRGFGARVH